MITLLHFSGFEENNYYDDIIRGVKAIYMNL